MTVEIALHRGYDVPAQVIYDAWTDVEQLRAWLCPGGSWQGEVRVGAPYVMYMLYEGRQYEHHGSFLRLEPPSLIEFTWIQEQGTHGKESIVRIEITALGAASCEMTLTHSKLPDQERADSHYGGWSALLEIVARHVGSS